MTAEYLSLGEVLRVLQIGEVELRDLIATGRLVIVGESGSGKIGREEVMRLKEEWEANPTTKMAKPVPKPPPDPPQGD